jgi:4-aminobutyrate aminotransferase
MKDAHAEGDGNRSDARARWQHAHTGGPERDLLARDAAAFLHQDLSTPCLTTVAKAEGIWIEDHSGRRWMDFHGNSVHHVGYAHPRVLSAIRDQLERLTFAPRRFACEPAVELAEKLAAIAPGEAAKKCLFTTGGSDAIEVALKIARAATGRFKTLSFWDAFHGAGMGAASVGGEATFRSGPAGPLLPGAEHVAPFACYRCPYGHPGPDVCGIACAGMVEYVLAREGDIAAVIAEPMRAVPYVAPAGFWARVREACDRHGTLLIFDEIPTGLGKTGAMFASQHEGAVPDITVLGKALGGAVLPIAAVIADARLDVAGAWAIGHYTHEKNPVTARAALETLAIVEEEGLPDRAAELGRHAAARLHELAARSPHIGDVRGRGLLIGVEIVAGRDGREPDPARAERILYRCLAQGLGFKTTMGNVLTLSPPLVIDRDDLDRALDIVAAAVLEADDAGA